MSDWSDLPGDLLRIIIHRHKLWPELLVCVCRSWRSNLLVNTTTTTTTTKKTSTPQRIIPSDGIANTSLGFHLSHRTIYLLTPRNILNAPSWPVKIEEKVSPMGERKHRLMKLMSPLSRYPLKNKPLPNLFPKVIDSRKFKVKELGQEHVLYYRQDSSSLYQEKVVMVWLDSSTLDQTTTKEVRGGKFILLTIDATGKLAVFRSGDKSWTVIIEGHEDEKEFLLRPRPRYDDVIVYRGEMLLGVDSEGRLVRVENDKTTNLTLVANPSFDVGVRDDGGDRKKYLVESKEHDELLLVDAYTEWNDVDPNWVTRFKVYKLDEEGKKWVRVWRLGNRVLFLGEGSVFESSTSDLHRKTAARGHLIFFECLWGLGVFDMISDRAHALVKDCGYRDLFWPVPEWLASCKWDEWPTRARRRARHQAKESVKY